MGNPVVYWMIMVDRLDTQVVIEKDISTLLILQFWYRVFIKYCVFFQKFSKVCHLSLASTRLLLVVQKITSQ